MISVAVLASSTPLTVTVCGASQFPVVNVSVSGLAVATVCDPIPTATLTGPPTGCVSRTSVYVAVPFSCTFSAVAESVAPFASLSVTANVASASATAP